MLLSGLMTCLPGKIRPLFCSAGTVQWKHESYCNLSVWYQDKDNMALRVLSSYDNNRIPEHTRWCLCNNRQLEKEKHIHRSHRPARRRDIRCIRTSTIPKYTFIYKYVYIPQEKKCRTIYLHEMLVLLCQGPFNQWTWIHMQKVHSKTTPTLSS